MMNKNAAVLWTGGKDCALAFHIAREQGYIIKSLVTFIPGGYDFVAHPLEFMRYQAQSSGLPHRTIEITEPFKSGYELAIKALKENHGIETLVTGDIAEVDGYPNWIRECSKFSGMHVLTPLWKLERKKILAEMISHNFKIIFSCLKKPWFTDELLGMEIDEGSIAELEDIKSRTGLDICGENGEYHTLTLDGPIFNRSIHINNFSKRFRDSLMYIEIGDVVLREK